MFPFFLLLAKIKSQVWDWCRFYQDINSGIRFPKEMNQ